MAFEIGVAANHVDLWDKLLAFLTTNPDLVASGQNWTVGWQAPAGATNETDLVLVGPGMGGTDQIYVGMRRVDSPATDHYMLWLNGHAGIMPSATQYTEHVNPSTQVGAYLDATSMPYWFVANGRRFAAVMRVGTVYETFYAGLFLPYADPVQYSYPMFIGGSINLGYGANTNLNWKRTENFHTNYTQAVGGASDSTSAYMMTPDGVWYRVTDSNVVASAQVAPFQNRGGLNTHLSSSDGFGLYSQLYKLNAALGGGYSLEPATLTANNPVDQTYGVLDGIYHVASEGTYAEDTVSVGGVDHLVFQNIWRTDAVNKAALALE